MRRPVNVIPIQWSRSADQLNEEWKARAACLAHPKLPWTPEKTPPMEVIATMGAVCAQCPVITSCANYALHTNHGHGVDGGFYAGVWLPNGEGSENRTQRSMARRRLRTLIPRKRGIHS